MKDNAEPSEEKSLQAMRTITEVSSQLDVPQHVLRFWETRFRHVKPLKRAGGRRYYRTVDITLLTRIRDLLYKEGYTIRGVQKLIQEQGLRQFIGVIDQVPSSLSDNNPQAPSNHQSDHIPSQHPTSIIPSSLSRATPQQALNTNIPSSLKTQNLNEHSKQADNNYRNGLSQIEEKLSLLRQNLLALNNRLELK